MADFYNDKEQTSDVIEDSRASIPPPSGIVIFFNDDYTTKEFVVDVLVSVFHKSESEANVLMETVHKKGSSEIGIYSLDIAETRAAITKSKAKEQGFPLQVKVKPIYLSF